MVVSYKTGSGDLGDYPTEEAIPELTESLALALDLEPAVLNPTAAIPKHDMHPAIADLLGIDVIRPLTQREMAGLFVGQTAEHQAIEGKLMRRATAEREQITWTDFTFSAPKSFSVALIAEPDVENRAILEKAFLRASDAVVDAVIREIGIVRTKQGASFYQTAGHVAVVSYDHYTSRPVDGMPAAMNRHRHNIAFQAIIDDAGKVGAAYLHRMKGRVHAWGKAGHDTLGRILASHGVRVERDKHGLLHLSDVPRELCALFADRSAKGEELARAYAASRGKDWDLLDPKHRAEMVSHAVRASRRAKDGPGDLQGWIKRIDAAGYKPASLLGRAVVPVVAGVTIAPPRVKRFTEAYAAVVGRMKAAASSVRQTAQRVVRRASNLVQRAKVSGRSIKQSGRQTMSASHEAPEQEQRYRQRAEVPRIERVAIAVASGRWSEYEAIQHMMRRWDQQNPKPVIPENPRSFELTRTAQQIEVWEDRRIKAQLQVINRLDVLVDKLRNGIADKPKTEGIIVADKPTERQRPTEAQRETARHAPRAIVEPQIAQAQQAAQRQLQAQHQHRRHNHGPSL